MNYIPYLIISLGILLLIFAIITKYNKKKLVATESINEIKYKNSMIHLFLITGISLIILSLLSLLKVLSINLLTVLFLPNIILLYYIRMVIINKKYTAIRK